MTATLFADAPKVGTFHAAGESAGYRVMGWALRRLAGPPRPPGARCRPTPMALAQGALGGEYELLFNGVEVDRFADGPAHPTDGPTIFFLGRHEPRKGLEVLLEALADLPADVRLWVGGDGPQTDELRERFGHDARIEWLGRISDDERAARMRGLHACTARRRCGASPSAWCCSRRWPSGCALVASDLDGHRNVATDGVDALLAPVGDAAALAKALRRVLDDDGLRAELVAGGRRRADELSMAHLAERYVAIYEQRHRR